MMTGKASTDSSTRSVPLSVPVYNEDWERQTTKSGLVSPRRLAHGDNEHADIRCRFQLQIGLGLPVGLVMTLLTTGAASTVFQHQVVAVPMDLRLPILELDIRPEELLFVQQLPSVTLLLEETLRLRRY